jgi:hypothetical protein
MDVARQTELTTDALQAHHDIMMGHMANIQNALQGQEPDEQKTTPQGGTQVAGDVVPIQRKEPIQLWNVDKPAGYEAQTPEQAGETMKGMMKGNIIKLTPGDKRSELELTRLAMEGPQSDKPVTYSVSGKLGEHVSGPVDATDLHHALKILQIMNMFSGAVGTTLKGEQK